MSRSWTQFLSLTAVALLMAVALPASAQQAPASQLWTARDVTTTLRFDPEPLQDFHIEIRDVAPVVEQSQPLAFTFHAPKPYGLTFTAPGGAFDDFVGGTLRHRGELVLVSGKTTVSLGTFELRRGAEPRTFDIVTTDGEVIFHATHMHAFLDLEAQRLSVRNMDLRLTKGFAERLGLPQHAGHAMGQLELTATVDIPEGVDMGEGACTSPQWDLDVDVALTGLNAVLQERRDSSSGLIVISPSATLGNVGAADVPWYEMFTSPSPPHNNDQHPYLVWALYRIQNGRIEMLAQSAVKHAFFSVNSGCGCFGGHILWVDCGDTYGNGTNDSSSWLAPRDEITAHTAIWDRCGSWFDGNCDDVKSIPPHTLFDNRLVVDEDELDLPGAQYFFEAWYIVRDDVNIFNTMGFREINPEFSGAAWSFGFVTTLKEGPTLNAWVNPASPGAGERNVTLDTGEGHAQLAVKTTDLGGGSYRYEFALMNHDFDRQIRSITIPIAPGTNVSNLFFGDLDTNGANDWQVTVGANSVTWTTPAGDPGNNALDWGTMFNFGFQADAEPGEADATLGVLEAGSPTQLSAGTLAPGLGPIFEDGFESGNTSAWSATVQ